MSSINGNSELLTTYLIINGKSQKSSDESTFEVRNSFNKVVGISSCATSQDCQEAINVANQLFPSWERTPISQKQDIFHKAAELVKGEKYKKIIVEATKRGHFGAGAEEKPLMLVARQAMERPLQEQ